MFKMFSEVEIIGHLYTKGKFNLDETKLVDELNLNFLKFTFLKFMS